MILKARLIFLNYKWFLLNKTLILSFDLFVSSSSDNVKIKLDKYLEQSLLPGIPDFDMCGRSMRLSIIYYKINLWIF